MMRLGAAFSLRIPANTKYSVAVLEGEGDRQRTLGVDLVFVDQAPKARPFARLETPATEY